MTQTASLPTSKLSKLVATISHITDLTYHVPLLFLFLPFVGNCHVLLVLRTSVKCLQLVVFVLRSVSVDEKGSSWLRLESKSTVFHEPQMALATHCFSVPEK